MRTPLMILCVLLVSLGVEAQSFNAAEVEAVDKQFDEGFVKKDINMVFENVADDAAFYGTDPNDRWTKSSFRTMVEKNMQNDKYTFKTVSRQITPLAGGMMAVVTKQVDWPRLIKTPLREVVVYENVNGWKLKYFTINVLLPDDQLPGLNQMLSTQTVKK